MKGRIKRVLQRKDEDIFLLAINIMTRQFDPHSTYLSPYNAEDFEIDMSLKLGGIGALLSNSATEDYAIIVSLVQVVLQKKMVNWSQMTKL
jgi:carboxyl-terminal processing protease